MLELESDLEVQERLVSLLPTHKFYVGGTKDGASIPDNAAFISEYNSRTLDVLSDIRRQYMLVRVQIKIRSDIENIKTAIDLQREIFQKLHKTSWTTGEGIEIESIRRLNKLSSDQDEQKRHVIPTNYELQYYIDLDA